MITRYRTLLSTSLSPWTGYGNDGIALAQTLQRAQHDVALMPRSVSTPLPSDVAQLFMKQVEGRYDVLLDHVDPGASGTSPSLAKAARQRVLWSMWEFTNLAPEMLEGPKPVKDKLQTYDTVVCYDEVSREAFEPHLRSDQRVVIQQGGYDASAWVTEGRPSRDWSGTFRFAMLGALNDRKNPWAAIKAFSLLKERHGAAFDAQLHLKTVVRSLHPKIEERYPGVRVHYASWSPDEVKAFYGNCHVYLAPSWGEGKNLPAVEAQTTGMACLATKFGGHAQWMPHTSAFEIPFTMGEHVPGMASARADVEGLADQMWFLYNNRDKARQQGDLASRVLPALMDWSVVVRKLEEALY